LFTTYKFKPFTMRKLLLLLMTGTVLLACNNSKDKTKSDTKASDEPVADSRSVATTTPGPSPGKTELQIASAPYEKFLGSFVGPFGDNKITMLITAMAGDSVVGRTIVANNNRPFVGTFTKNGDAYTFTAKEPGDHKDDGAFSFTISDADPDKVKGSWQSFDKKRPAKQYELSRREFKYDPSVGSYPQASQRLLKAADVENEMKEDLQFMRNEIFARHGYSFNKKNLRMMFELEDWYVPNTVDIKGYLTDIEKKNIELIKRYEKYAEEYGDEYGR
jgi:hypothetical protein